MQLTSQSLDTGVQTSVISVSTVGCQASSEENLLDALPMESLIEILSKLFTKYSIAAGVSVRDDFLLLSVKAMLQLKRNYRNNVVYNLVKGLGTTRPDGSDSRFPTKMMPMGLVEYITNFFVADTVQQVGILLSSCVCVYE